MTCKEANSFIESVKNLGSRPGLDNITNLCALLDDPQNQVKTIHIAGTNGKGSTSAMIASVLCSAGYKTGLYVSPHLVSYRDGMLINGRQISEKDFSGVVAIIKEKAQILHTKGIYPTEFEILTAAAFLWFYQKGCDFAVIETGLGGRLDATNVIKKPLVSVITAISKDHTAILGDTITAITREKCGIIKPGGFTVCYPEQYAEAKAQIAEAAGEKSNRLTIPDLHALTSRNEGLSGTDVSYKGTDFHLPLPGGHQVMNAVTALEAVFALTFYGFHITAREIRNGMENVRIPARQEVISKKPLVLIDGAHNLQGVQALERTLKNFLPGKRTAVIMGMLKDKDYEACIQKIAALSGVFIAVKPENDRALEASVAAGIAAGICGDTAAYDDYGKAVEDALRFAGEEGAVIICGSLYLAGPMRKLFLTRKKID